MGAKACLVFICMVYPAPGAGAELRTAAADYFEAGLNTPAQSALGITRSVTQMCPIYQNIWEVHTD